MENQNKPYATPSQEDFLLSGYKGLCCRNVDIDGERLGYTRLRNRVHPPPMVEKQRGGKRKRKASQTRPLIHVC